MSSSEAKALASISNGSVGDAGLDLDDDAAIESLAKKFKVSVAAMQNRLSGGWFWG